MATKICPECNQGNMYFSGDGRAQECEKCHYRIEIATPDRTLQQLKDDTDLLPIQTTTSYREGQAGSTRLLLVQGIGAVKAGDSEEAYTNLTRLVVVEPGGDKTGGEALLPGAGVGFEADKPGCPARSGHFRRPSQTG